MQSAATMAPIPADKTSEARPETKMLREGTKSSTKSSASQQQPAVAKKAPAIRYPFWFGGSASSFAACVTHPLDLVKVRLQVRRPDAPKNMVGTVLHILRTDGPAGLYAGLSASLLRQMSYSTVRFGVYEELKARAMKRLEDRQAADAGTGSGKKKQKQQPSFLVLVAIASFSGFIGGVAGNAADVLNVRMQQDASLPLQERRNYRHALDGLVRMGREEGLRSWFRGVLPNSTRAAAMTASQLASYDAVKGLLLRNTPMQDNLTTHFASSFLAGVVAATVTSPVDVIKTRVMTATSSEGLVTTLRTIYANEGMRWMFKGWVPSFLRLGP